MKREQKLKHSSAFYRGPLKIEGFNVVFSIMISAVEHVFPHGKSVERAPIHQQSKHPQQKTDISVFSPAATEDMFPRQAPVRPVSSRGSAIIDAKYIGTLN